MSSVRSVFGTLTAGLVAATVIVITGGTSQPAVAAACPGETGVTVVVDYAEHGGLQVGCAPRAGGQTASAAFAQAGFTLEHVDRGPGTGMVCKVAGVPADASCSAAPSADAYWSLWSAHGTSGSWAYASRGVTQLPVTDGGYVAFAWHQGTGRAQPPAVAPKRSSPAGPSPSAKPTSKPAPTREKPTEPSPSAPTPTRPSPAPATEPPAVAPESGPARPARPSGSTSASASPSQPQESERDAAEAGAASSGVPTVDDVTQGPPEGGSMTGAEADGMVDGLPWWVPILVIALVAAAGGTLIVRRR